MTAMWELNISFSICMFVIALQQIIQHYITTYSALFSWQEEELAGSPMLCLLSDNKSWTLVGVSNWRIACSKSGTERPRLYDKITSNIEWIHKTMSAISWVSLRIIMCTMNWLIHQNSYLKRSEGVTGQIKILSLLTM